MQKVIYFVQTICAKKLLTANRSVCAVAWISTFYDSPACDVIIMVNLTQTANSEPAGTGPSRDSAQLEALVGGVAGPVGPGTAGGAGFVFEGHDCEERQN